MKKLINLSLTLSFILIAMACAKETKPVPTHALTPEPKVVINPSTQYVSADQNTVMTEIRTQNSDSWLTPFEIDYESLPDWIEIKGVYIDHFNYRIAPNETRNDRTGTFYVYTDGRRVPITVNQNTIKVDVDTYNTPTGVHWNLTITNTGEKPVGISWNKFELIYYYNKTYSLTDLKSLFEDKILESGEGYSLTRSFASNNFECGNINLEYVVKEKKYTRGLTL